MCCPWLSVCCLFVVAPPSLRFGLGSGVTQTKRSSTSVLPCVFASTGVCRARWGTTWDDLSHAICSVFPFPCAKKNISPESPCAPTNHHPHPNTNMPGLLPWLGGTFFVLYPLGKALNSARKLVYPLARAFYVPLDAYRKFEAKNLLHKEYRKGRRWFSRDEKDEINQIVRTIGATCLGATALIALGAYEDNSQSYTPSKDLAWWYKRTYKPGEHDFYAGALDSLKAEFKQHKERRRLSAGPSDIATLDRDRRWKRKKNSELSDEWPTVRW